jgi:two-component system sensor histidine kinase UhpB
MVYRRRMYPSRRLEYLYGAVTAITGCTADELSADPERVRRSIHPDDWSIVDRANRPESLQHTIVLRWIHPDGRVVWAEHRRVPVFAPDGTLIAIDGIARDVTETIATLDELRESKAQMRQLAARIEAAREEERAAVAREIHDELGQTLTALKLEIMRAVPLVREPGAVDRLQSMIGLAEWAIRTVQRIATTLRPATLDHLGLPEAIASEADAFHARTGVRCRVAMETDATGLTPEQQTTVFRVFQEALTNVARHANASAVSVRIREDGSAFELVIRDNGRGIAPQHVHGPRSIGLLGMRERADRIGGSFEITGGPRRGTTVTIRVPKQPSTTQEPGI